MKAASGSRASTFFRCRTRRRSIACACTLASALSRERFSEKEQAKKTTSKQSRAGKKASLVEQQRANLFTTSVANVAPGELVVVEIEYLEDLRYEDGRFSIRFPMTLTPRYIPGQALPDRQGKRLVGATPTRSRMHPWLRHQW